MKKIITIYFILLSTLVFSQKMFLGNQYELSNTQPRFDDAESFFYFEWELNPADFPNKISDIETLKKLNKNNAIEYKTTKTKEEIVVDVLINGEKFSASNYKKGLLDGVKTFFHANGSVFQEILYKNGKANGPYKIYNDRNKLVLETNYKDNLKNGLRKFNSFRGDDLIFEGNYVNGKLTGDVKITSGKSIFFYPNDLKKGNVKRFIDDRLVSEYSIISEYRINGDAKYYDSETGKVIEKIPYYLGEINGFVEYYGSNGELQYKNEYKFNKQVGRHARYLDDKTLVSEEYYDQEGLKTGVWKYYDRSGKVNSEKTYSNDKLEGINKEYKNGILTESLEYHEDKMNGAAKYFEQKSGNLKMEALYKDNIKLNEKQYYPEGTVFYETIFSSEGIRTAVRYYDKTGILLHENKWGQDKKPIGIHKRLVPDKNDNLYVETETEYDLGGNQLYNTNFNSNGSYTKKQLKNGKWHGITTIYDSKTNIKTEIYYFESKKVTEEEFKKLNQK